MAALLQNKHPNSKNMHESLEVLRYLQKDHYVIIEREGSAIDKIFANFTKTDKKGYLIQFQDKSQINFNNGIEHVKIVTQKHNLYLDKVFITSISPPIVTGSVSAFRTNGFHKRNISYYRLFIPLRKKDDFRVHFTRVGYSTKKHLSSNCIRINYKELDLDLFLYTEKQNDISYLILDTCTKCSFAHFMEYCFSSLVSFGYVTGHLYQDEGYFFSYDNSDLQTPNQIYYSEFRESLHSNYSPISSIAYRHVRDAKFAKQASANLRTLTQNEFSKLCEWAHISVELSSILLLIVEASTSSLLVMPSGYSVALEGLTDLIVEKHEDKLAPIKDKRTAKAIRSELKTIIASYSNHLDEHSIKILNYRIDNINQLTNQSKLVKPFEVLKFELTKEDIKAIEHRNHFLHGRITLETDDKHDIHAANEEIYYISLRLYTLLSVLILKSVGYDNRL
jgi:hypothetical protein